ncbi:MAG: hypothetical protein QN120_01005 [Armatimonadota bacterium]|nr:hypothetical protein [Armatimonadota bacterium]
MNRAPTTLGVLVLLAVGLLASASATAQRPRRGVAFLVDSWHPISHADVIGTRLLAGYRLGAQQVDSPVTVSSVYQMAPRADHLGAQLAARHGVRLTSSVAEALLDDPAATHPKLAVHGAVIAARTLVDLRAPAEGSPQFRLFRETMAVFDRTGSVVPVFVDKNLAATLDESLTLVAEAARRRVPLMGGSVVPWVPLEPPLPAGRRMQLAIAVSAAPYHLYAVHAAELLQAALETRGQREVGVAWVREVGRGLWTMPDRDRWGVDLLEVLLSAARTRSPRAPRVPDGLTADDFVVLVEYLDGARGVIALLPRQFDDAEFRLGVRYDGGRDYVGGLVLGGAPYDHFGYLVQALVEFFTTGRPVVPVERTLLSTGISALGLQSRHASGQVMAARPLAVTYATPRPVGR